jgi:hypothetical protein
MKIQSRDSKVACDFTINVGDVWSAEIPGKKKDWLLDMLLVS